MSVKQRIYVVSALLLFSAVLLSCSSDEQRFESDPVAVAQIRTHSAKLSSGQKLTAEEFVVLKSLFDKYPGSTSVRKQYETVLTVREDWTALAEFYEATDPSLLTDVQKANLAKVNLKLGRFKEALAVALEVGPQNNLEMLTVAAASYFFLGNYAKSKELLNASWEKVIKEKEVDAMAIRGLIYFHDGDNAKAREVLERTLEIDPANISALNALSRVYSAEGDTENAKELQARVQKAFDRRTRDEELKINTVERFHSLEEAYRAKQYGEVIRIGKELLPTASRQNKAAIYQFLYNSHKALGNQKEAADVLSEARKLQQ